MGYQIHHKEFGVFQGECIGFGFWHLLSQTPEYGYYKFSTFEMAKEYVEFLCSDKCYEKLNIDDLIIEEFDYNESERLKEIGKMILLAEKIMPIGKE